MADLINSLLYCNGNQIIDASNNPFRFCSIDWGGGEDSHPYLMGLDYMNWQQVMETISSLGFNTVRIHVNARSVLDDSRIYNVNYVLNNDLVSLSYLEVLDLIFGYALTIKLRIIVSMHCCEGGHSSQDNFGIRPSNGLWYDIGGASDGTDGGGNIGTMSPSNFAQAWVTLASRWFNKPAIAAFDLLNQPTGDSLPGCVWGDGSNRDIQAMYTLVGNLIQYKNVSPLIICSGIVNVMADQVEGDLNLPLAHPVLLRIPNKVVYSVQEYCNEITGYNTSDSGDDYISRMNSTWGVMVNANVAPVFVSGCGATCLTDESRAWATTFTSYLNGEASGGISFSSSQKGISWNWLEWNVADGTTSDLGILTSWQDTTPVAAQQDFWTQIIS